MNEKIMQHKSLNKSQLECTCSVMFSIDMWTCRPAKRRIDHLQVTLPNGIE